MIPFLDIQATYNELKFELDEAIKNVLCSGTYILGEEVEQFENNWAQFCNSKYAITVGNGYDALRLSLNALGIGPGDEVIVPSNTYIATWLAVHQCGAKIVPVEPIKETFNIDPEKIERAINSKTKLILPVHLFGQPADLDPILVLAKKHKLYVLEDAAQAHGASYRGVPIGSHGDAVAWSFYPGKNLGAFGDGGAITTNNPDIAKSLCLLRNYGSNQKYVHEVIGHNSRLDPIQAAILNIKLNYLNEWNTRRKKIAERYLLELNSQKLILPYIPSWADPVWHLFVIQHPKRDQLIKKLREAGISTLVHYPIPPHKQKAFLSLNNNYGDLKIAEQLSSNSLSLPIGPHMTTECLEYVIDAVNNIATNL